MPPIELDGLDAIIPWLGRTVLAVLVELASIAQDLRDPWWTLRTGWTATGVRSCARPRF
jgi:hypothetical protein